MKRRRALFVISLVSLALVALAAVTWVRAQSGLRKAEQLAGYGLWDGARQQLKSYLWLHPRDGRARMMMAEALVRDESLSARDSVPLAIEHLRQIPDDSPYAAQAKTEHGRLEFLILHKPATAEALFRQACQLNPELGDPYYMLWKLYEVTGRAHLASDSFWKSFELTPPEQRSARLAEWYTSQFYPGTATRALDERLGFLVDPNESLSTVEARRFLRFRETEPTSPLGHAALASWFRFSGKPKDALKVLEDGLRVADGAQQDDFFNASLVGTLIDLGEFERAEECFQQWPPAEDNYEYLLHKAIVLDEIQNKSDEAIACYERALVTWPGPVDWRTRHRYSNCLARLGKRSEAVAVRELAKQIEQHMEQEKHSAVREALAQLDNPKSLDEIVEFYDRLGCQREAEAWRGEMVRLQLRSRPRFPNPISNN